VELFLKGFLIPAAASLLAVLFTAKLSPGLRAGAIVGVAVVAYFLTSIAGQFSLPQGVVSSESPPANPTPTLARPVPQEEPGEPAGRPQAGKIDAPEAKRIDTVPPRGLRESEEDRFLQRYVAGSEAQAADRLGGPP
jgi:hypothetical protein